MSEGTDQRERLPVAFEENGRFRVDEMRLSQRVVMCAGLAERLRFVDLNNQAQGHWLDLFDRDESLLLARIASFDRYRRQTDFLRLCESAPVGQLAHQVLQLAQQLNDWFALLLGTHVPDAAAVRDAIQQRVDRQLGGQLAWVIKDHGAARFEGLLLQQVHENLHPIWHSAEAVAAPPAQQLPRQTLRIVFFSLLTAIAQLQRMARARLEATLDGEHHEPAPGLLLAFLRLYGDVQAQVNTFTARHIDFYYRRCLQLLPRPAQADHVHVVCQRDPRSDLDVVVPAGLRFPAGKDAAGQPLSFAAPQPLALSDARVAALCTLLLQRDEKIAPESDLGYVTGIKSHWLGLPDAESPAVPFFGGGPGSSEATLGLVLATPLLLLQEGQREVEVRLRLAWPGQSQRSLLRQLLDTRTQADFQTALGAFFACWMLADEDLLADPLQRRLLRRHAVSMVGAPAEPESGIGSPLYLMCRGADAADGEYQPRELAFFKYVNDLFEVSLSGAAGWLRVERIQVGRPPRSGVGKEAPAPNIKTTNAQKPAQEPAQKPAPKPASPPPGAGLQLTLFLRPEDPAIVGCDPALHGTMHGAPWPTRLPLLRLQVSPRARIHPLSLLQAAELQEAELQVRVKGVRDLVLQNNLGPLDPSKAFAPFGPLPTTSSYLVFGSAEAACKNLDALTLHLQWGGLPQDAGGFAQHYNAYGAEQSQGPYTAAFSILRGGSWKPCAGVSSCQPLFDDAGGGGPLRENQRVEIDEASVRSHARATAAPLVLGSGARDGLVRLQISSPPGAFGHAAYAPLLSHAVTARTRTSTRLLKRGAVALPNPPYTPVLERFSLDYSASTTLRPTPEHNGQARTEAPGDAERLLHIHPFGLSELRPDADTRFHGVLPPMRSDGNLCIGLQASALDGPLSLLFQLREDGAAQLQRMAQRAVGQGQGQGQGQDRDPVRWFYLAQNRWRALAPHQVLADTTQGFLTSGVVTLDLQGGARNDNTVFAGGLFWLRVGCPSGRGSAAALVSVHAQAVTLVRELAAAADQSVQADGDAMPATASTTTTTTTTTTAPASAAPETPLPAGFITQPLLNVPGLSGVLQIEASVGLRLAEDERQLQIRAGERLRHKNRASLAWDVERLVLERFPEVFKVKCFSPHEIPAGSGLPTGAVLVVVVPNVRRNHAADSTLAPRLNARALQAIEDHLARRASPFARLQVRNATYERVQVRCGLKLDRGAQTGAVLRQVQRVLTDYLSPWFDIGYGPRFEWLLRCDDVEAQVRGVPGVAAVGALSLLHVARSDDGFHHWADTARPETVGLPADSPSADQLRHRAPWSLALPLQDHLLELLREEPSAPSASPAKAVKRANNQPPASGLAQLRVGSTIVVGRSPPQRPQAIEVRHDSA